MVALAQQSNILDFPTVAPQGKSNEWYTPARYVEAAREVMGSIDLDPASCEMANRTVKATRFYSKEDNGLSLPWYGNVWCNPPYGSTKPGSGKKEWKGGASNKTSQQRMFIEKLMAGYQSGSVKQAILLVTACTYCIYFQPLWEYPICFMRKKIRFYGEEQIEDKRQVFGNVSIYLGPNEQKFIDVFSQFGTIAKRVSQPRHTVAAPSLWEVTE